MVFEGVDMARPEDEDALYNLLLGLHKENGIFTVDEQRSREFIRQATERRGGVIGVIRGEMLEGTIGMVLDQWWYTSDWCLSERWCYVHPSFRRKNHARRLVDFAKFCAAELKVPLQMGIMSTKQTEAKMRLYRRQLTPIGELYLYKNGAPVVTGMEMSDGRQN